jgi:hypothetical protein
MRCRHRTAVAVLALLAGCRTDWQGKDAYRQCRPAIADYPKTPAPSCDALRMCANEATLDAAENAKLQQMITAGGCSPP